MKSIDIRSESAIKLLAEFLDMEIPYHMGNIDEPSRGRFPNAEHFAHGTFYWGTQLNSSFMLSLLFLFRRCL